MHNRVLLALVFLLLAGCGQPPAQPHIYVVGVDLSRSFWSTSLATEKRFADLSKTKVQEISYRIREYLNEINIITESRDFVKLTRVESGNFKKTVARDAIRKETENVIDMVNVLANDIGTPQDKEYLIGKMKSGMASLRILMDKRDYARVPSDSSGPIYNEDVNPAALARVNRFMGKISEELGKFSYSVSIPDQPRLLQELHADVMWLLGMVEADIRGKNSSPIDRKWIESGVYGKMKDLNTILYFGIGNAKSTVCRPLLGDLNATIGTLIEKSYTDGIKVFSNSTDYQLFIQRSFSEIENLLKDWGGLDPDIGLQVTFIIVGDGKNDPAGKFENSQEYDQSLLSGIKEVFDSRKKVNGGPTSPLAAVNSIDIRFCVPQKRYNTDILDSWAKLLQADPSEESPAVLYYMFENLKQNGKYTEESIKKLVE